MLLLLLYGLAPAWALKIDCKPLMLPRFKVVRRSGCPVLKLRFLMSPAPPGLREDIEERPSEDKGCKICWLLMALYISCGTLCQFR